MTTEKTVNYTEAQTAEVLAQYAAGSTVEQIATAVGRTVRSITMKLVKEGVYQKKVKASTAGQLTKADMAAAIAARYSMNDAAEKDLEKLTKATLVQLMAV